MKRFKITYRCFGDSRRRVDYINAKSGNAALQRLRQYHSTVVQILGCEQITRLF